MGLDDIFAADGAVMVEWPERIDPWLPADRLWITLDYQSETRRMMRFTAAGERSAELLQAFKQSAFGV